MTGDQTGDICFYSKIFLDSLILHTLCRAANEVVFKDSNITLNIYDTLEALQVIHLEPERLFSFEENRLCSAHIFMHNSESTLRNLGQDDIVSISRKASDLRSVSIIYSIVLGPLKVTGMCKA